MLTCEHIVKRYGAHTALDDVSLTVPAGGTATFSWRGIEGQSDLGHVEAARDWARRFLERPEDPETPTGPKGEAGVDNSPVDPFTRLTGKRQR